MNASTADTGSATIIDQPAARQLRRSADDRMLDRFAQYRAEIDGVGVHFVHEPARGGGGSRWFSVMAGRVASSSCCRWSRF